MLNLSQEDINLYFPVIGLTVYPGGVVVERTCSLDLNQIRHTHLRGVIAMLSKRSLNRLALLVRSCGVKFTSVITLTYGLNYPMSGKIAKKHLNAFLVAARREWGPFEYFWVCEFQSRGAVHFHLATTLPSPDYLQRDSFASIWARISTPDWLYCRLEDKPLTEGEIFDGRLMSVSVRNVHVHYKAWEKVRSDDGMGRYLAKYANKLRQKKVPEWYGDVGRFWGVSRGVRLPKGERYHGTEAEVREVLEAKGRNVGGWGVLPKIVLA